MAKLDRFEGVAGGHYQRIPVLVEVETEELVDAETYFACSEQVVAKGLPLARFLDRVPFGARVHGLPAEYSEFVERLGAAEILD